MSKLWSQLEAKKIRPFRLTSGMKSRSFRPAAKIHSDNFSPIAGNGGVAKWEGIGLQNRHEWVRLPSPPPSANAVDCLFHLS